MSLRAFNVRVRRFNSSVQAQAQLAVEADRAVPAGYRGTDPELNKKSNTERKPLLEKAAASWVAYRNLRKGK